jgi:hypothetical protein
MDQQTPCAGAIGAVWVTDCLITSDWALELKPARG